MKILDKVKNLVERDTSVKRVAEDLQLTSELILLVRMIFADGQMKPEELQNFKRICKIAFDIPEKDVPEVVKYLQDFGYETTAADAASMFSSLDEERKKSLLLHLMSIAKADNFVHEDEVGMIRKVADILNISAADLERFGSGQKPCATVHPHFPDNAVAPITDYPSHAAVLGQVQRLHGILWVGAQPRRAGGIVAERWCF